MLVCSYRHHLELPILVLVLDHKGVKLALRNCPREAHGVGSHICHCHVPQAWLQGVLSGCKNLFWLWNRDRDGGRLLGKALLSLGGNYMPCFCGAREVGLMETSTDWQHLSGNSPLLSSCQDLGLCLGGSVLVVTETWESG